MPIVEPAASWPGISPNRVGEPPVKPRKVHANDGVGLAFESEPVKLLEESPEFLKVLQHFPEADDGVDGHVEGQVHSRSRHAGPAGSEEPRLQTGGERLIIE